MEVTRNISETKKEQPVVTLSDLSDCSDDNVSSIDSGSDNENEKPRRLYGYKRWKRDYLKCRPPVDQMKASIDEKMKEYDEGIQQAFEAMKSQQNVPDEDGWIKVTRVGKRNTNTDGTIVVTAAKREDLKALKSKAKPKTFPDFYGFRRRESKLDKLAELKKKFEEDKKKIAALKDSRKFKPY